MMIENLDGKKWQQWIIEFRMDMDEPSRANQVIKIFHRMENNPFESNMIYFRISIVVLHGT